LQHHLSLLPQNSHGAQGDQHQPLKLMNQYLTPDIFQSSIAFIFIYHL